MKADLHLHSVYSDGLYTPDYVCSLAKARGLSLLSITDHDTLLGQEDKINSAKRHGLRYLSGWEISAYEGEEKVHILGYGCTENAVYETFMQKRVDAAQARAEERVRLLRKHGVMVTMDEVLSMRKRADIPVHTMHVARAAAPYLQLTEGEVYERWLSSGKPADVRLGRPTPLEAIDCIHKTGGVAVIAHPGRIHMERECLEKLMEYLKDNGLDGIEARYTTHTKAETDYFLRFAEKHSLFTTGGSDMHMEDGIHAVGSPDYTATQGLLEKVHLFTP